MIENSNGEFVKFNDCKKIVDKLLEEIKLLKDEEVDNSYIKLSKSNNYFEKPVELSQQSLEEGRRKGYISTDK